MKRLILLICLFLLGCQVSQVCFDTTCFAVEVAVTPEEQARGLMNRTSVEGGMVFVFEPAKLVKLWMKHTLIPLDMLWIYQGRVVYIERNVQPCRTEICPTYGPDVPTDYVLEINANASKGIELEDKVSVLIP